MPPTTLAEAVRQITDVGYQEGEDMYRAACEFLVDHRNELSQQVHIALPGGLSGNGDPVWVKVKDGSSERCSCGNERVILPGNPRTEFDPSPAGPHVMNAKNPVAYLKPRRGTKASTYFKLELLPDADGKGPAMSFIDEPFAPFVFSMSIFSTQGFTLGQLAEAIQKNNGKPPVLMHGKTKMPVFGINAVSLEGKVSLTITPDKDVELLMEEEPDNDHTCSSE